MAFGMEATELFQKALEASDDDELELAKRLGLKLRSANSQFQRWRTGKTKPDYEATMKLLDIAGLLRRPEDLERARKIEAQLAELQERLEQATRRRRTR